MGFSLLSALKKHLESTNHPPFEGDVDEYSYYVRDLTECDELSLTYEEHLTHRIDHLDFLCVYCGEFNPHMMKYHPKHCPERDCDDEKELEDDNGIQDKPKTQVEETDIDIEGKAKMRRKTSGLSKNKQKG